MSHAPDPSAATSVSIIHRAAEDRGGFYVERAGEPLGEMTYRRASDHIVIDHTRVDDALRGQGVARRLFDTAVAWAGAEGLEVRATCTYAKAQLEKDALARAARGAS